MKIVLFEPQWLTSWLKFRAECYPKYPHYATESFYQYRFLDCPANVRPIHALAIHNENVVGETYSVPVTMLANGQEYSAWAPADIMVSAEFRKVGLWRFLMTEAARHHATKSFIAVAAGQHTYAFYAMFGEHEALTVGRWFHFPLEFRSYFIRKGKSSGLAAVLNGVLQPAHWKRRRTLKRYTRLPDGTQINPVTVPDNFSNRPFIGTEFASVNDADWYHWRGRAVAGFKDTDQFFEVRRDNQVVGFAIGGVVSRHVADNTPPSRVGIIKECRTLSEHADVRPALLAHCAQWLIAHGAEEAVRIFAPAIQAEELSSLGFIPREDKQAVIGGPLLAAFKQTTAGICAYDDIEAREC